MTKKIDSAVAIFKAATAQAAAEGKTVSRKEMISMFMTELKMTDAGASTYYHNVSKRIMTEKAAESLLEDVKGDATTTESADTTESTASVEVDHAEGMEIETVTVVESEATTLGEMFDKVEADAEAEVKGKGKKKTAAPVERKVGVVSSEMDAYLASIDLNEIPRFLRK